MLFGPVDPIQDQRLGSTLRPLAMGLCVTHAAFAISHFYLLDGATSRSMIAISAISALALASLAIALGRRRPPAGYAHAVAAFIGYIIAANVLPYIAFTSRPEDSLHLLMLLLGAGALLSSLRWLLVVAVPSVMVWAAIAYQAPPDPGWFRFAFALATGAVIAVAMVMARLRLQRAASEANERTNAANAALRHELEERRHAEAQLRESEFRYRMLAENARDLIVYIGRDAKVEYASPSWANVEGVDYASMVGRDFLEVMAGLQGGAPPVELEAWPPEVERTFEIPSATGDGVQRFWEVRTGIARDRNGAFEGLHVAGRDITERRSAEERLEIARISLDTAGEIILRVDADARIVDANTTASRSLGYSRNELLSMSVKDLYPHFDMNAWPDIWANLSVVTPSIFEGFHRTRDGREVPVEIVLSRVGLHEQAIAFVRDITERLEAERSLRESEERFQALFNEATVGLLILSKDGINEQVNPAFSKMLGYEPGEPIGRSYAELTPVDEQDGFRRRGRDAADGAVGAERVAPPTGC